MTEDELKELEETFKLYDKDENGRLSVKEVGQLWRSIGENPTEAQIQEMFDAIDTDGSGSIDCKEFVSWISENGKKEEYPEESMREAFRVFDRDGNGYVSREELKRIMSELGDEPLSPEELDAIMNNFDDDGDDRINYDEFIEMAFTSRRMEFLEDRQDDEPLHEEEGEEY